MKYVVIEGKKKKGIKRVFHIKKVGDKVAVCGKKTVGEELPLESDWGIGGIDKIYCLKCSKIYLGRR